MTNHRVTFTNAAFERSHARAPRGHGCWAFQQTTSRNAFDHELVGELAFFTGTLTEARALAAERFAGVEFVAVLP